MLMPEGPSAAAAAAAAVFEEDALKLDAQEDALSLGGMRTRSGGRAQEDALGRTFSIEDTLSCRGGERRECEAHGAADWVARGRAATRG